MSPGSSQVDILPQEKPPLPTAPLCPLSSPTEESGVVTEATRLDRAVRDGCVYSYVAPVTSLLGFFLKENIFLALKVFLIHPSYQHVTSCKIQNLKGDRNPPPAGTGVATVDK